MVSGRIKLELESSEDAAVLLVVSRDYGIIPFKMYSFIPCLPPVSSRKKLVQVGLLKEIPESLKRRLHEVRVPVRWS